MRVLWNFQAVFLCFIYKYCFIKNLNEATKRVSLQILYLLNDEKGSKSEVSEKNQK